MKAIIFLLVFATTFLAQTEIDTTVLTTVDKSITIRTVDGVTWTKYELFIGKSHKECLDKIEAIKRR